MQATSPQKTQGGLGEEHSPAANTPSEGRSLITQPHSRDRRAHPYTSTTIWQEQQWAPLAKRPITSFLLRASALKIVIGTDKKHEAGKCQLVPIPATATLFKEFK